MNECMGLLCRDTGPLLLGRSLNLQYWDPTHFLAVGAQRPYMISYAMRLVVVSIWYIAECFKTCTVDSLIFEHGFELATTTAHGQTVSTDALKHGAIYGHRC